MGSLPAATASIALLFALAAACSSSSEQGSPDVPLPDRVPGADAGVPDATPPPGGPPPATCSDGKKDGDETDVDCGGASCPACADGKACAARRDCASLVCSGATCSRDVGCSDGSREGFTSLAKYRDIAACAGGWSLPGVQIGSAITPACGRASGNDSANTAGTGCGVADLCQPGWHVCASATEVGTKSGGAGCADAAVAGSFFVTRQSGPGFGQCGDGTNDLFGCGGVGGAPDPATCGVLTKSSNDLCTALPASFACGAVDIAEASNVTKTSADGGGALCCRD